MRTRLLTIMSLLTTAIGTLLLTATGAIARQTSGQEVPGGLRNVGPGRAPAHEVPGGLRNVGGPGTDAAVDPGGAEAAVQAVAGISLTWVLALLAVSALLGVALGYGLRAARAGGGTYVDGISAG